MDPQACLTEILSGLGRACKLQHKKDADSNVRYAFEIGEVTEHLRDLAGWLENGGFCPVPPLDFVKIVD